MSRLLGALALALAASGCSIDHLEVEVDDPVPTSSLPLEPGRTRYGYVLERIGPPSSIEATAGGFVLRYESYRVSEWKGSARYRQGKLAYAFGSGDFGSVVFDFDRAGVLLGWSRTTGPLDLGWGGIVGHAQSPELFFEAQEYAPVAPAHDWGSELDRPPGG